MSTCFRRLMLTLCGVLGTVGLAGGQESNAEQAVLEFWSEVSEILEELNQHHPLPPTQQEAVAHGVGAIQAGKDGVTYADLVRQVSAAAPESLKTICCEAWSKRVSSGQEPHQVTQRFIAGLLAAVPGRVRWIPAGEAQVTRQLQENRYVGIGISLSWNEVHDQAEIVQVFYGGPAWTAKLEAGDLLTTIDGETAVGVGLRDVITRLRGPLNTELSVEVERGGKKIAADMTRLEVPIATLEGVERRSVERWQVSTPDDAAIGYLKLVRVAGSTAAEMRSLLRQAKEQKCEGLILDFREAVAGDFHQTLMLADALCGEGVIGRQRVDGRVEEVRSRTPGDWLDRPIVILAPDGGNAELVWLVDALQQRENVRVVGHLSVTDGFLSKNVELASGGLLENLPHGFLLMHHPQRLEEAVRQKVVGDQGGLKAGQIGILPDVEASRTAASQGYDPQDAMIQAARQLLKVK
jgi:C-terminal peptidase prc